MAEWTHRYHAEAAALEGDLMLPFSTPIERQAYAKIEALEPRYLSQHAESFRTEGIISYSEAHTQVSGHREDKHGNPFITLSTSVVENLNILNVVTADRIVAQVSTEHQVSTDENRRYVPRVTFLGSNFFNLRIGGYPMDVKLDLKLIEGPPQDPPPQEVGWCALKSFREAVAKRMGIVRAHPNLPEKVQERFAACDNPPEKERCIEYSLVNAITGEFPGAPAHGNMIDIPHFGKIFLGVVQIKESQPTNNTDVYKQTLIDLTMIDVHMGCIASGNVMCASAKTNGGSTPPTG